jgi:hypothetical protein
MTIPLEWLLIAGGLALGGAIALAVRAGERKRRAAYEEYCMMRGFQFEPARAAGERRFQEFLDVFNQGHSRKWGYTIAGRLHGCPFTAFEYRWVTGGGKSSTTHRIGGIVWERDPPDLPKFTLSPEGWFSRVGQFFGAQDIDFVESPEFSRGYRLKGPNEQAIRAVMTTEVRNFFAATPKQLVAGGGRFLLWWQDGRLPAVDRLDEFLEQGDQVRRRFFKG